MAHITKLLMIYTGISANADGLLPHDQSTVMLYTEFTKVSNSKSDLQTHSRPLAIIPFNRPYAISY